MVTSELSGASPGEKRTAGVEPDHSDVAALDELAMTISTPDVSQLVEPPEL